MASSTVSKWPSSSSYFTGSVLTGSCAILSWSNKIFYSTACSPATNIYYNWAASILASATVWICSPFSSTVGFSLSSFSFFAYFSAASFASFACLSAGFIFAHGFSSLNNASAAAATAAAWLAVSDSESYNLAPECGLVASAAYDACAWAINNAYWSARLAVPAPA